MTPLGYWFGVKKQKPADPVKANPVLESYFKKNGITSNNNLEVELYKKKKDFFILCLLVWLLIYYSLYW